MQTTDLLTSSYKNLRVPDSVDNLFSETSTTGFIRVNSGLVAGLVGLMGTHPASVIDVEHDLDCVTICPIMKALLPCVQRDSRGPRQHSSATEWQQTLSWLRETPPKGGGLVTPDTSLM